MPLTWGCMKNHWQVKLVVTQDPKNISDRYRTTP